MNKYTPKVGDIIHASSPGPQSTMKKIEFTSLFPSLGNQDLLNTYSNFSLLCSVIAEVDNEAELARLSELQPDKRYRIVIEEV